MKTATVGSISHGTLRTEDLLSAFSAELSYHLNRNPEGEAWATCDGVSNRARYVALVAEAEAVEDFDSDEAAEMVDSLSDALEEFAPPYCYFGATEGDGSDFGFWPCMDQIEELPHLVEAEDRTRAEDCRAMGEDSKLVNDHGNVTVFAADGTVLIELV